MDSVCAGGDPPRAAGGGRGRGAALGRAARGLERVGVGGRRHRGAPGAKGTGVRGISRLVVEYSKVVHESSLLTCVK